MSLHVELRINDKRIGGVTIWREKGSTDLDSVNEYGWKHMDHGRCLSSGTVHHRYGDGAVALAGAVLRLAATKERASREGA